MKYTKNALHVLTIKSFKGLGIGNAWIVKNIKGNESVEVVVDLMNEKISSKITVNEFNQKKSELINHLETYLENCCDGFVAIGDSNFPPCRGKVKDSERPVIIFYKGRIDLLSHVNKNVTVIGLLNPEGDIEERERKIVNELVKSGATIVSGLAFGCDSIAHQQALDSNGATIAILPSPLFNIMPQRNRGLAYKIVEEGGLLITEYASDFNNPMELSGRYKERDRLQALFCDLIILAASYSQSSANRWAIYGQKLDSGARLAMGYAKDYGIPRSVMYDEKADVSNPMFDLNREILYDDKSVLIIESNKPPINFDKILFKARSVDSEPTQGSFFD